MRGIRERLDTDVVVGAEGYLFELERRGYLQAGPYVPEVVLDAPDAVRQLHREFVRAGSDVVEAFTYYGHREKLKVIGKEDVSLPRRRGRVAKVDLFQPGGDRCPGRDAGSRRSSRPKR
jgi:betaine-homocysteine S-methyltransferase